MAQVSSTWTNYRVSSSVLSSVASTAESRAATSPRRAVHHQVGRAVWGAVNYILLLLLTYPGYLLYRHGMGFWRGRHDADVCARMTSVPAEFWTGHPDTCAELIHKDFEAHLSTLVAVLDFVIVARGVWEALRWARVAVVKCVQVARKVSG